MERAEYRVIRYRPEDRAQVIELQKNLWGRNLELNSAYLDWKHLRNPYLSEPLIYLAMHGEQAVGMRSFVGAKWEFGSPRHTLVLPLESDMVIAPDHRNRGLVSLIMNAALKDLADKGYTYVLSMGTRPKVLASNMRLGWRIAGSLLPLGRPGTELTLPGESRTNHFDSLDSISEECNRKLGRVSIEKVPRAREMAELAGRLAEDVRIRHVRDETYYAWRFENPRSKYRFLFWRDPAMEGYVVLQAAAFPSTEPIGIIDWQAVSDQVRAELLQSVLRLACDRTLITWSATLTEKEHSLLDAAGFKSLPETIISYPWVAALRPVREEMLSQEWRLGGQRLLEIGSWDFRMLNSRAF
jgi:GNAT superfamily N-acetyltransferase